MRNFPRKGGGGVFHRPWFRRAAIIAAALLIVIIATFIAVRCFFLHKAAAPEPSPPETVTEFQSSPSPELSPSPSPEPSPSPVPSLEPSISTNKPIRMVIPAIKADMRVAAMGPDNEGSFEIYPGVKVISWDKDSPVPGDSGTSQLGGHNRYAKVTGRLWYLDTLKVGDSLTFYFDDGEVREFRLESVFVYYMPTMPYDEIAKSTGKPRIVITTCKWPFSTKWGTSEYRITATFVPAEGFVAPDPPVIPVPAGTPNPAYK